MDSKQEKIASYIDEFKKGNKPYSKKRGKFDKLFGENKNKILELVMVNSVPIKVIYDDLVERKVIEDSPYVSFQQWIKRNIDDLKKAQHAEEKVDESHEQHGDQNNEYICEEVEGNSEAVACIEVQDSREMFYGFDMNNEPDQVTNPLPQMYEISKEYIFNIFTNDTSLSNEKIVYILLYEISVRGENIFKDIWPFMLMKEGENIEQYYSRLQHVINSKASYSFGITNATACLWDIAFVCGYDGCKIIRRTV